MNRCVKLIAFLFILVQNFLSFSTSVKISVYYETLCPDSIAFINNQLQPNYEIFDKVLELELIPYGHAKEETINGTETFRCQHGPKECYGNRVHGCVINSETTATSEAFVCCSESSELPTSTETFKQCASSLSVPWYKVEKCLSSGQADKIMAKNGEKTAQLNPTWIPTIVFNDVFNSSDSQLAQQDLKAVICRYLDYKPEQCNTFKVNVVLI